MAWIGTRVLPTFIPADAIPAESRLRIDSTVLAFTLAIAIATPLLFAVLPALAAARTDAGTLLTASRSMTSSRRTQRTRSLLVVMECALALALLVSAGLLARTFQHLRSVDPGFDPTHVLELHLTLPEARYPTAARGREFFDDVVARVRALPGVQAAAAATGLPLTPSSTELPVVTGDRSYTRLEDLESARYTLVTPAYFATMGIALRAGRPFTAQDRRGAPGVAIVNEALARRFFAGQNPVGRPILLGVPDNLNRPGLLPAGLEHFEWLTIVGLAADARNDGVSRPAVPEAYVPLAQSLDLRVMAASAAVVIRATGDPAGLANAVRAQVHAADPEQPIARLRTMDIALGGSLQQPRFNALLLSLFAGLALALSVVGIYGVVSHTVAQRTHEIGIRLAMGASPQGIRRLILAQSLRMAATGIAAGTAGAVAATRVLNGLLFGVTPGDPLTFAAAAGGLLLVAVVASWIPVRRATRLDPMMALRNE